MKVWPPFEVTETGVAPVFSSLVFDAIQEGMCCADMGPSRRVARQFRRHGLYRLCVMSRSQGAVRGLYHIPTASWAVSDRCEFAAGALIQESVSLQKSDWRAPRALLSITRSATSQPLLQHFKSLRI